MPLPFQRSPPVPSRLTLFALLYAWANIIHLLSFPEWINGLHFVGWTLFITSAALALRPSSIPLLLTALSLRLAFTLIWTPMIREHLFLEGLFTCGILIAVLLRIRFFRHFLSLDHKQREALFDSFAPFLRVTTLVVYAAVTVCKINTDFLNPEKSEAVQLLFWSAAYHPFIPTGIWAQHASIWATFLFEGGIPVLLIFRRTRWLGLMAGLFFHTLMGLLPLKIFSFTVAMYLLLYVWLPPQSTQRIHFAFLKLSKTFKLKPDTFALIFYIISGSIGMFYAARNGFNLDMRTLDLGILIWFFISIVVVAGLWIVRKLPPENSSSFYRIQSPILKTFILFIIFNCACPYIGLKNRSALSMHSNLRTAKGHWNHLFLPEFIRVFNYQNNLVTIIDSNLPDFEAIQKANMPLPYFEFRRWCRRAKADFYVDYLGPKGTFKRFDKKNGHGSDAALMEAYPLLEKFLCFNPVGASYDYIPELLPRVGPARNQIPKYDAKNPQ
ncbi:MAG: hypothetical protein ACI92G_001505 [Candidatus Pelagisphaera sp.]|jgi:hypothetical protein